MVVALVEKFSNVSISLEYNSFLIRYSLHLINRFHPLEHEDVKQFSKCNFRFLFTMVK